MKCYLHNEEDATSQCSICGRGLCFQCTDKYKKPICNCCISSRYKKERINIFAILFLMLVLFLIFFNLSFVRVMPVLTERILVSIVFAYIVAAIPWGWCTLSEFTSTSFLILPIIGWFIYLYIKFLLSIIVGLLSIPYHILKTMITWKKINNLITSSKVGLQ